MNPTIGVVDSSGQPLTGDAANLTLSVITDGVAAAYAGDITELGAGRYAVEVAEAGTLQSVTGVTSTEGGVVIPASWHNVPNVGSVALTLTVLDDQLVPLAVPGLKVTLQNSTQTDQGIYDWTDALGQVHVSRDPGTYKATVLTTPQYAQAAAATVIVVGPAPEEHEITVVYSALPVAVNPTGCACYMDMLNADGLTPVGAGLGSLRVKQVIARSAGDTLVWADDKDNDAPRLTNAAGRVSIELPQGRTFILVATWPDGREEPREILVPVAASKDIGQYFQPYTAAAP